MTRDDRPEFIILLYVFVQIDESVGLISALHVLISALLHCDTQNRLKNLLDNLILELHTYFMCFRHRLLLALQFLTGFIGINEFFFMRSTLQTNGCARQWLRVRGMNVGYFIGRKRIGSQLLFVDLVGLWTTVYYAMQRLSLLTCVNLLYIIALHLHLEAYM